ncbi:MAG: DUF5804 family protein [Haloarculaceae archaeon]
MTQVCIVGDREVNLQYELLSRETARDALATYDLHEHFENALAVETVSLGAAVSLLNDLNWYLVRFARDAFVLEPSVSETEWLSRELAAAIRDNELDPAETDRFLKVYGVVEPEAEPASENDAPEGEENDGRPPEPTAERAPDLVEPMYVARTGPELPEYDLREVDDTLVVRVREDEFGGEKQR